MNHSALHPLQSDLPVAQVAGRVSAALKDSPLVLLSAPPGAGKSTWLPLHLLSVLPEGKILMLEPRRIAARQVAQRLSENLGQECGLTVGYRVRFEHRISSSTRIEVLTEGILTRMLVQDPLLEGVSLVIFDEFHERGIQTDLAFAFARRSQQLLRDDLRILLMSATMDVASLSQALGAPFIQAQGRQYPVTVAYARQDPDVRDLPSAVAHEVLRLHRQVSGNILAFLPGQAEIRNCQALLCSRLEGTEVCPLYGSLPFAEQRRAVGNPVAGLRRVVLSTPVAETSLTIPGVTAVVDSGFFRQMVSDPQTGLSRLFTVRISQDMAAQRTGRAGRLGPGICMRLWTPQRQLTMDENRRPEILDADLASLVLQTVAFGERDLGALPWVTPPPAERLSASVRLLRSLGAMDDSDRITPLGKRMSQLPCHPRISRMILGARDDREGALACDIAALIEDRDTPSDLVKIRDLSDMLISLRQARDRGVDSQDWRHVIRSASEFLRLSGLRADNGHFLATDAGRLLACAFPERVAQSTDRDGEYRLSGGGELVHLDPEDPLCASCLIAVAALRTRKGRPQQVEMAAPVAREDLLGMAQSVERVAWDALRGGVVAERELRLGSLVLASLPVRDVSAEETVAAVCQAVSRDGLSLLNFDARTQLLQRRVETVALWHPEMGFPDLSPQHLIAGASQWLPSCLMAGDRILSTASELQKIDLYRVLWNLIPPELQWKLDSLAPEYIQVPSGSRIRVDYRKGASDPVLSVRLQECFGMEDTPRVDQGRRKVLMELLSPGYKPVQLTQDLRGFWTGVYHEVRKELRRRYPKHYWPENPLDAEACRDIRKKAEGMTGRHQ